MRIIKIMNLSSPPPHPGSQEEFSSLVSKESGRQVKPKGRLFFIVVRTVFPLPFVFLHFSFHLPLPRPLFLWGPISSRCNVVLPLVKGRLSFSPWPPTVLANRHSRSPPSFQPPRAAAGGSTCRPPWAGRRSLTPGEGGRPNGRAGCGGGALAPARPPVPGRR